MGSASSQHWTSDGSRIALRDDHGQVIAQTGPDGTRWAIERDALGQPVSIEGPDDQRWQITRNDLGHPLEVTGPEGTTAFAYDNTDLPDRPTTVTDAVGATHQRKWNALGQVTAQIDCYIDSNIANASDKWSPWWFRDQVKNGEPWDYKQQGSDYEDFGNFNYGATGAAFGFPDSVLLNEAGRAQQAAGTSLPSWGSPGPSLFPFLDTAPFGDDPQDQYWIKEGIDFYRNREQWNTPIQLGP